MKQYLLRLCCYGLSSCLRHLNNARPVSLPEIWPNLQKIATEIKPFELTT